MTCKLLSDAYSVILQLFIALMALVSLFYKREYVDKEPKRPFLVWALDVSKQGISEGTLHIYNIAFGILLPLLERDDRDIDQCAWYLVNELMDTIIGSTIVYFLMAAIMHFAKKYNVVELEQTGWYGNPPRYSYYFKQLGSFLCCTYSAKAVITVIALNNVDLVESIGTWCFKALGVSADLELTLVMLFFPLIFTMIQFWIFDMFLGFRPDEGVGGEYGLMPTEADGDGQHGHGVHRGRAGSSDSNSSGLWASLVTSPGGGTSGMTNVMDNPMPMPMPMMDMSRDPGQVGKATGSVGNASVRSF